MENIRIRDSGWEKIGSGIWDGKNSGPGWKKFGSGIRDKPPGSATLHFYVDLAQIVGEWRSQRQQHSHGANRREVTVVREGHLPSDKAPSCTSLFFFVLYSTLLHLPPLRFHCADGMLGSNPGPLQLVHWQSDALTTRLDLIRNRLDLIRD
jgi:hypothetical protein